MNARSPRHWFVFALCLFPLVSFAPRVAGARDQATPGFAARPGFTLDVPQFSDDEVSSLTKTLDGLLLQTPGAREAHGRPVSFLTSAARSVFGEYFRQLQGGRLTPAQESRVLAYLDDLASAQPSADAARLARDTREAIRTLTIGKVAPDIVGRDLDGENLRLAEYRGKVTVLVFSADWCAICRTLHPYERLMLELYRNWPFALLGVETGSSRDAVRDANARERLTYRAWWDEPEEIEGAGPIGTAWHVDGFPAVYVLDAKGVIRFVDLHDEDLLKAVRQLLDETVR